MSRLILFVNDYDSKFDSGLNKNKNNENKELIMRVRTDYSIY